ncbi:hypothetical protein UMM65_12410 [Aureibaculum sp. 2210JD6-5]|uniref:hypothetical protein n=1 Tax=Aureibaculum sp. 2210JD6-5 TaxID=3103957 RepID=UPI002AADE569|nr:hypothetical protein [Aureibaculum sp. 2210JD6-5]MDY7396047.1 hypothetical protein [Aureibaculum sp. 2210JD6-5]
MKLKLSNASSIEWILRIAISMTFLGHGIFAIKSNPNWIKYLEFVGFSIENAEKVIVIIGVIDVLVAITILLKPYKYVILWAFLWTFSTALVRPLAGESIWQFVERASNWAVPLTLFFLINMRSKNQL